MNRLASTMARSTLRGLVLLPLALLTSQCSSDDDPVSRSTEVGAAGKAGMGGHAVGTGVAGNDMGGASGTTETFSGGGGSNENAGSGPAGSAGTSGSGGVAPRYCRMTARMPQYPFFQCPSEYCSALANAIGMSDRKLQIFEGATVRAGHCGNSTGLDAVYFAGGGVEATECFYRAGAFVGWVTWGDTQVNVEGCRITSGPVIFGEVPESVLNPAPIICGDLTAYRPLSDSSSGGTAGASGVAAGTAGDSSIGVVAGSAGAASVGSCYRAATATCEPC